MKTVLSLHAFSAAKQIAFTALFAALCLIGTLVVQIPAPLGGYLNVGDVFVLLAGWCLGPLYGGVAAAVGSSLADIIAFPAYAPATFLIKGADALAAYAVWALLHKAFTNEKLDPLGRIAGALVGETLMVAGYAVFDGLVAGWGAAVANLPFNLIQAGVCAAGAVIAVGVLTHYRQTRKYFPHLG